MTEHAVCFGDAGRLVGVVTDPPAPGAPSARPAIVLAGAGIVHRVGPHRLYVKLARRLAAMGFMVLRFDFSGIGDSLAADDDRPLAERAVRETRQAMDWLRDTRGVDRFALMGVCSGAGFSFRTTCADQRVVAVSLINPAAHRWGTAHERHRTMLRHYWRMTASRSFRAKNVRRLLTLDVNREGIVKTITGRLRNVTSPVAETPLAVDITASFEAAIARGVRILLVYSEADEGLDYYEAFLRPRLEPLCDSAALRFEMIRGANHTFTLLAHQRELVDTVSAWAEALE